MYIEILDISIHRDLINLAAKVNEKVLSPRYDMIRKNFIDHIGTKEETDALREALLEKLRKERNIDVEGFYSALTKLDHEHFGKDYGKKFELNDEYMDKFHVIINKYLPEDWDSDPNSILK